MNPDSHLPLSEGQEHDVSEWEKAAAAVLRKARRLSDDDPDAAVWDELTRSTLDGIAISPLGTEALVADLPDPVRPPARGDGWDVRALLADPDPKASHDAALTDLENGVTSLWVQVGESGVGVGDLATVLDGVLLDVAPVVLDAPSDPLGAARAFAALAEGTNARSRDQPRGRPGRELACAGFREARRRCSTTEVARLPRWPASSGAVLSWSTAPRSTTSVHPTCRSSATCSRSAPTTCGRSTGPESRSTTPRGWSSSGWRRATTSS